jgi:hypothetical protein
MNALLENDTRTKATTMIMLVLSIALLITCWPNVGVAEDTREETDEDTVEIITPRDGSEVIGAVQIIARVPACYCDENTKLYVNDKFYEEGHCFECPGTDQLFVHYFNSYLRDNGEYTLKVLGKHNESYDTVTVTINNTGEKRYYPSDILLYPFNNTKVGGKVTITDYARVCNCTARPSIYIDGEKVSTLESNDWVLFFGMNYEQFQYEIDTTRLTNGEHTVRVDDKHGGFGNEIVLIVQNQGGPGPGEEEEEDDDPPIHGPEDNDDASDDEDGIFQGPGKHVLFASIAILLAVVLIVLIQLNLRAKKRKDDNEGPGDQSP